MFSGPQRSGSVEAPSNSFLSRSSSNQPLQPPRASVTRLAVASRAPAGGRLNGGVRRPRMTDE